jgi:metal-responsive CopG/Arc/MetJ family transcriptional regulator
MAEDYEKRSPVIQEALYEALKNIQQQKEKENGNDEKIESSKD